MKTFAVFTAIMATLFIQPCPAPSVIGGAIILGSVGGLAGGLLPALIRKECAKNPADCPRDTVEEDKVASCMSDAYMAGEKYTVTIENGTTAIVDGMPSSCMAQIKSYNTHSNINILNQIHGSVIVLNDTAVKLTQLKPAMISELRSAFVHS
jgi:predicted regulator of Ras-like GTPase activity (Roadblock/LC7/MglB family)